MLRAHQPGLSSWAPAEAAQRLDEAVRLLDAGMTLRAAGDLSFRICLRRGGEILEWLSNLDETQARYHERYQAFRARYGEFEDGHAADAIIRQVFRD